MPFLHFFPTGLEERNRNQIVRHHGNEGFIGAETDIRVKFSSISKNQQTSKNFYGRNDENYPYKY